MKLFSSEIGHNYSTYSFGYCQYLEREAEDTLAQIYAAGYLPFSGSPDIIGIAYMARSARIRLEDWAPNSENRRIFRKFEQVERQVVPAVDLANDPKMFEFCLAYFAERHGAGVMPAERLRYVLNSGWVTHIAQYRLEGKVIAYVWLGQDAEATHFYYSFYDLAYVNLSLGLWLMVDIALACQAGGRQYLYLGTAYGQKGLYKTNFDQLEWWDGHDWQEDREALRARCRLDESRLLDHTDIWKEEIELF